VIQGILTISDRDTIIPLLSYLVRFLGGVRAIKAIVEKNILTFYDKGILVPILEQMKQVD